VACSQLHPQEVSTEQGADIDELGPIDWIVVEFPGSRFNGEDGPELVALQDSGIIRILDLVIVKKDDDGAYEVFELRPGS
jgi:hypothetical protein